MVRSRGFETICGDRQKPALDRPLASLDLRPSSRAAIRRSLWAANKGVWPEYANYVFDEPTVASGNGNEGRSFIVFVIKVARGNWGKAVVVIFQTMQEAWVSHTAGWFSPREGDQRGH